MLILTCLVLFILTWVLVRKYGFESLLVFTCPIHRIYLDYGFALKPYYIVVLVGIFAALASKRGSVPGDKGDRTFKLIFAFVISILASTLMNGGNPVSFRHIIVFVIVTVGAYLVYRKINTISDIRRMMSIYIATGLFMGLTGLFFYGLFFLRPELCVEGSVFNGVIYDLDRFWTWPSLQSVDVGPNAYAMNLIPFMFVSMGMAIAAKKTVTRVYSGFVFLLLFANLFLSFSRGCLVSFLSVALLIVLLSKRSKFLKFTYVSILLVVFPLVFKYIGGYYITYSIMKGAYSQGGGDLMSARGDLFMASVQVFLSHPAFGVGQGVISDPDFVGKQSHNTYIELLAENGIVPFLLFAILLVSLFKKMSYIRKQVGIYTKYYFCMPFLFGMLGLLVAAVPTSAITMTLLWIHMAVVFAFYKVIKQETSNALLSEPVPQESAGVNLSNA